MLIFGLSICPELIDTDRFGGVGMGEIGFF